MGPRKRSAVIVAHPDDEALWCGGHILANPGRRWTIVALCRGDDPDRAPRFRRALDYLGAEGGMGRLDDGAEQRPLPPQEVEETITRLLGPAERYELVLTHGPAGEYTRHRRHEECYRAVIELWKRGRIESGRLWAFAYQDGGGARLPRPRADADRRERLTERIWRRKLELIEGIYGFAPESWEARAALREEAFWCAGSAEEMIRRAATMGRAR